MRRILFISLALLLIPSFAFAASARGAGRIDRDAIAYYARVQADSGTIISAHDTNQAVKHAKRYGYWTAVKHWSSAQFGVKKDEAGAVSKLYCLVANDAVQATGANQPAWAANQQNGKAGITGGLAKGLSLSVLSTFRNVGSGGLISVCKLTDTATADQHIVFVDRNAANSSRAVQLCNSSSLLPAAGYGSQGRRLDGDSIAGVQGGTLGASAFVFSSLFDWTNSNLYVRANGAATATNETFQVDGSTSDTDSAAITLMNVGSMSGGLRGQMYSAMLLQPATLSTIQAFERFLNDQWRAY